MSTSKSSTTASNSAAPASQASQNGSYGSHEDLYDDVTVPASSSTVFPSSVVHTPPSVLRDTTSPTCLEEDLAKNAQKKLTCLEETISVVNDAFGGPSVLASEAVSVPPFPIHPALEDGSISSQSQSVNCSSHSSNTPCEEPMPGPKGQPYVLDTLEAQTQFSRKLDELLLEVIREQQAHPLSQTSSASISCSIAAAGFSRPSTSTSSSVYAADISLDRSTGQSTVSSLTNSASVSCTSPSNDSATAHSNVGSSAGDTDSDHSSKGLEFANTPLAAHFVYGSISDDGDDAEMDIIEDQLSVCDQQPHTVAADPIQPGTPFPLNNLMTPSAPKKTQYHFYLPKAIQHSSRKRSRLMSISDRPEQDRLQPGECMRAQSTSSGSSSATNIGRRHVPPVVADEKKADSAGEPKRPKLSPDTDRPAQAAHPRTKLLAKEPASFRRAASLRTDPPAKVISIAEVKLRPAVATVIYPKSAQDATADEDPDSANYAPTQPVTPVAKSPAVYSSAPGSPFPIISPSALGPTPASPLTAADAAEARLLSLVKREFAARVSDGLLPLGTDTHQTSAGDAISVDSEQEMWNALGEDVSNGKIKTRENEMEEDAPGSEPPNLKSAEDTPLYLGIEEDFRVKVIEWILDAKPPHFSSKPSKCSNLHSQLSESPNTRWHAAHLFTRYFLRLGSSPLSSPIPEPSSDEKGRRVLHGREALTWDIAVACMSLSVKFHRDFLHPLYPVIVDDYLILAPHTMEYEDLETAHRDVLSAVDYCIGSCTPGAYIEELLIALPSIRTFVDARGDWEFALAEAWEILFDSLVDVSYLHHSVYVVTGCALVLGIVESIVYKRKTDAAIKSKYGSDALSKRRRGMKCECGKLWTKAFKSVRCVEQDMQDLLGIMQPSWVKCIEWLKAIEA